MSTVRVYVGIDYHDQQLQVCVMDAMGRVLVNCGCANSASALAALVRPHGAMVFVAIESCCGAANLADELIVAYQWSVDMAHAGYVKRMKQNPDKTDYSDARLLADLERVGYLPMVWLAPAAIRQLRQVSRYRQALADQRRVIKLRIRALLREHRLKPAEGVNPWTKAWLAWARHAVKSLIGTDYVMTQLLLDLEHVNRKIVAAEKRLDAMAGGDPLVEHLASLRGFGRLTAIILRAELGRFDRFRNGKQLSRFCGLSPRNASTGSERSRRRPDSRQQSAVANDNHRVSASVDALLTALAKDEARPDGPKQTGQRGDGGGGQSLSALAVSPGQGDATGGVRKKPKPPGEKNGSRRSCRHLVLMRASSSAPWAQRSLGDGAVLIASKLPTWARIIPVLG